MMWLIQGIGLLATIVNILNVQLKHRRAILVVTIAAALLWALHYFLLQATTAVAMSLVMCSVLILFYYTDAHRPRWALIAALGAVAVAGAIFWQGWYSLLAIAASLLAVTAFWQKREQTIRAILIGTSIAWLAYNAIILSYVGVGKEIFAILSSIIALHRFSTRHRIAEHG